MSPLEKSIVVSTEQITGLMLLCGNDSIREPHVCVCVCVKKGEGGDVGWLLVGGNKPREVFLECRNSGWITYSTTPTFTAHMVHLPSTTQKSDFCQL